MAEETPKQPRDRRDIQTRTQMGSGGGGFPEPAKATDEVVAPEAKPEEKPEVKGGE